MTIGTSNGLAFEDDFQHAAGIPIPKEDNNVIDPETTPDIGTQDQNEVKPNPSNDKDNAIKIRPIKVSDQQTDPNDMTGMFNTKLSPDQEADYETKFKPGDSYDYDMRGWYKANPNADPNAEGVHYPDTFKKPNHPTFSDQSQYHSDDTPGGHWDQQPDKSYSFTPSSTNLKYQSKEDLQDYFNRVEKGNKLNLPQPNVEDRRDQSLPDMLKGWLGSKFNMERFNAIMAHPMMSSSAAIEANKPLPSETPLGDQLGLKDLPQPPAPGMIDKLLGTNGADRYQTWPERFVRGMVPDGLMQNLEGISTGKVPMWAMDPQTGEIHTSPEAIKEGVGLASSATYLDTLGRGLNPPGFGGPGSLTVHLRGDLHDALKEVGTDDAAHQQFQQLLQQVRRQPSRITEAPPEVPSPVLSVEPPHGSFQQQPWRPEDFHYPEALDTWAHPEDISEVPGASSWTKRELQEAKTRFDTQPVTKKGGLSLVENTESSSGTAHHFNFMNKEGNIGELRLYERQAGRELHVGWIGTIAGEGKNTIGHGEIKALAQILKDKFPQAEYITGFRVSGARAVSGSGPMDARMQIRKPVIR